MNNILIQQLILSLVGGLMGAIIGALVGGYLSYKGAIDAAKKQIDYLYSQEKEKRDYEEAQQVKVLKQALQAEIQENLVLATQWQTDYSKSILTTEAWAIYKGHISTLLPTVQEKLIHAYAGIKKYNALVEYDRLRVNPGLGMMDNSIKIEAKKVVDICKLVMDELSKS